MKKYIGVTLIFGLISLVIWQFMNEPETKVIVQKSEAEGRQIVATDFTLPQLNGEDFTLSQTRGKITVINFWASWCGPCKMEAPHLQEFYEKYSDRVEIVAVNITSKDKESDAAAFAKRYGFTFPVLLDKSGEISTMFGAFVIPTTIFLNEKGEIIHEYAGPMEKEFMVDLLEL